jgi:Uma2 family endonuclease
MFVLAFAATWPQDFGAGIRLMFAGGAHRANMEGGAVDATMPQASFKLGLEDYELFPDDGGRHELIDGEHVVTAAPAPRHQLVLMRLGTALFTFVETRHLGLVLPAPTDVILSPHDVVQPDLFFIAAARLGIVRQRIEGPPDLTIEILSPSSRRTEEVLKRRAYEQWGVTELWIVDPDVDRLHVYRLEAAKGFGRARELAAEYGDALETPLLPGFSMMLADLFVHAPFDARL